MAHLGLRRRQRWRMDECEAPPHPYAPRPPVLLAPLRATFQVARDALAMIALRPLRPLRPLRVARCLNRLARVPVKIPGTARAANSTDSILQIYLHIACVLALHSHSVYFFFFTRGESKRAGAGPDAEKKTENHQFHKTGRIVTRRYCKYCS